MSKPDDMATDLADDDGPAMISIPVEPAPARPAMALEYLRHVAWKQDPGDSGLQSMEITPDERATEKAALDCLRLYFNGEMDYGGTPPEART